MTMIHELKTCPGSFRAIKMGLKTAEYRKDDRGFDTGDELILREYDITKEEFTGDRVTALVTHILRAGDTFGMCDATIAPGYCVMSIRVIRCRG